MVVLLYVGGDPKLPRGVLKVGQAHVRGDPSKPPKLYDCLTLRGIYPFERLFFERLLRKKIKCLQLYTSLVLEIKKRLKL